MRVSAVCAMCSVYLLDLLHLLQCCFHYIQGASLSWKVVEFRKTIFQAWKSWKIAKVMESHEKSWKMIIMSCNFYRNCRSSRTVNELVLDCCDNVIFVNMCK